MRRVRTCCTMACGLYPFMNTHVPGSIGGMNVARACPNMLAQGQQVEEAQGPEGTRVAAVPEHLALDRDDVGEHVPVGDDDALGLGRGAGREHDLGGVAGGGGVGGGGRRAGVRRGRAQVGEAPGLDAVEPGRGHVVADEQEPGVDAPGDALEERRRGPVVDGHHHRAPQQAPPEADDPLRAVLAPEQHRVPGPDARPGEAGREGRRRPPHLVVAVPPHPVAVVVDQELGVPAHAFVEVVEQGVPFHARIMVESGGPPGPARSADGDADVRRHQGLARRPRLLYELLDGADGEEPQIERQGHVRGEEPPGPPPP